jgi:putative endonuclease
VWFVYILKCSDGSLYTGISNDVQARLKQHNSGKGSKYIRAKRPAVLVYTLEFETKSQALRREAEIKRLSRDQKIELVGKKR